VNDRSRQDRSERQTQSAAGLPGDPPVTGTSAGGPGAPRCAAMATSGQQNEAAYEPFVEEHYGHVFAVCYGVLLNVHDAQDAAQETMLKGLMELAEGNKPERFRAWLISVARNHCIDHLRRQKRRKPPDPEPPPTALQQNEKAEQDLEQAIRRLPGELRVPLLMFYFDGRNPQAIAENLNISYSGVCHRLRAARQQLHELLTERAQE
jgi:RNA polymerase sigma factor (sigma-70 family)